MRRYTVTELEVELPARSVHLLGVQPLELAARGVKGALLYALQLKREARPQLLSAARENQRWSGQFPLCMHARAHIKAASLPSHTHVTHAHLQPCLHDLLLAGRPSWLGRRRALLLLLENVPMVPTCKWSHTRERAQPKRGGGLPRARNGTWHAELQQRWKRDTFLARTLATCTWTR